ncbi:unnamed protein product [Amoebophrya sp. A25]|nr:unnamed protein product [Amoebophrya sp. A25]|eukprot:GSA25T00022052001.1
MEQVEGEKDKNGDLFGYCTGVAENDETATTERRFLSPSPRLAQQERQQGVLQKERKRKILAQDQIRKHVFAGAHLSNKEMKEAGDIFSLRWRNAMRLRTKSESFKEEQRRWREEERGEFNLFPLGVGGVPEQDAGVREECLSDWERAWTIQGLSEQYRENREWSAEEFRL